MPCYRCGTRQVDPDRGESPWRRGVRGDRQVLICPDCQVVADWTSELDRCRVCSSVHLVRRLGEAECRDCGGVAAITGAGVGKDSEVPGLSSADVSGLSGADAPGLSEEVARALDRVLGRGPVGR